MTTQHSFLIESQIRDLIWREFGWSQEKVDAWMSTRNPLLGGVTPNEMIKKGRALKLLRFVETCLEENRPSKREKSSLGRK